MYGPFIAYVLKRWRDRLLPQFAEYCRLLEAAREESCTVGIIGLQSAGKSTLFNACLGYPILPSLLTKGTTCPVLVEWGTHPALAVELHSAARKMTVQVPARLPEGTFRELLEYVCLCVNEKIFYPENLGYFLQNENLSGGLSPNDIMFRSDDPRHTLILVLMLLNAHMDGIDGAGAGFRQAMEKRERLLERLKLNEGTVAMIRLAWDAAVLRGGVRLLDLPGLGSGGERDSQVAVSMSKKADVLLCMMTKEIVGARLKKVLDAVYEEANPLPVLVVNKAEEITGAEIVINSARQMLWPRRCACCLLSAAAGEARFLSQGIRVERTRYWRDTALPMFRKFSKSAQVSESLKETASQDLRDCFTKRYPCVRENGEAFCASLGEFIENVLPEITRQAGERRFRTAVYSDARAVALLRQLMRNETAFLSFAWKDPRYLWGELVLMCTAAFSRLGQFYAGAEKQLRRERASFEASLRSFSEDWEQSIGRLNRDFSQAAREKCVQLRSDSGLAVCKSYENLPNPAGLSGNDAILGWLMNLPAIFPFEVVLDPAMDAYLKAYDRAAGFLSQLSKQLEKARRQCANTLLQARQCVFEMHKERGYDTVLFSIYYGEAMDRMIRDALKRCEKGFPLESVHMEGYPRKAVFDWREYGRWFLKKRVQRAAVRTAAYSDGLCVLTLRKQQLLDSLSEQMISSQAAERLLRPLMLPKAEKYVIGKTQSLLQTCGEWEKEAAREAEKLEKQADILSAALRENMASDLHKLREWETMLSKDSKI